MGSDHDIIESPDAANALKQGGSTSQSMNAILPIKKRRKKRRIRLTDHVLRAKRKADRREKLLTIKREVTYIYNIKRFLNWAE